MQEAAHPEANIIFGAVIDDALGDEVRVTVIAAGFDGGTPAPTDGSRSIAHPAPAAEQPRERAVPAVLEPDEPAPAPAVPQAGVNGAPAAPSPAPSADSPAGPPTQGLEVPRVFDSEPRRRRDDDLDVPEFLK